MPTRSRPIDRAIAFSGRIATDVIRDVHDARLAAGLSQRELGGAVGLSRSQVARFERGTTRDIRLDLLCRLAVGVGLEPSVRLYPGGDAIRDKSQTRLLERLRIRLGPPARWRTEGPLVGRTDARAWDAVIDETGCADAVEAETRIRDLEATERRIALKARDDPTIQHVVLLLADTRWNRRVMAENRESLRSTYPIDTREALGCLRAGRCPGANALVFL